MAYSQNKERAIQDAFASARMENLKITPEIERSIRRILDGQITVEDRVRQIKEQQKQRRM